MAEKNIAAKSQETEKVLSAQDEQKRLREERKKMREEQKAQRKEAKRRARELDLQQEELEDETEGGSAPIVFVTFIIVVIWLAILALLIKLDVGGFGSTVLRPVLKDIPVINKILPADCAKGVYETVIKYAGHGVDILTYTPEHILSGIRSNQYTELESRINQMPIIDASTNFLDVIPDDPNKFLVTGDPDILDQIRKELSKQFHSYLSVYCSDPFFVEVMPAGIDKAHSLLKLLTSIGLTADEMICCGDGYNDLTMIETAGLGVAMANAQPAVLDKADYITKSNDEDGVLHVINEFMR